MNLVNRIYKIFFYADTEKNMLNKVAPEISESNRRSLMVFSLVALTFLSIMSVLSYVQTPLEGSRLLYIFGAVSSGAVFVLAGSAAKRRELLVLILMYFFLAMLLLFGIILGTVTVPNEITASFIALLLTTPQMFTDRPWRMYTLIFSSAVLFIFMVVTHKAPETWSSDIINSIVFSCISAICCTYMMKIKVERFCLVEQVRYMAETDQLTGLKNRNCYETRLQGASILKSGSIYCVYVDVNGLHELNNSQGHAAGDRMLCYIATVMQNIFGEEDTFRIGGDEFVAFGVDKDIEQVQQMISRMRVAVENAGYHVAVGMSHRTKEELEFTSLVKAAEIQMYQDKSSYYCQSGIDRRRR